jgi:hypothetical protein
MSLSLVVWRRNASQIEALATEWHCYKQSERYIHLGEKDYVSLTRHGCNIPVCVSVLFYNSFFNGYDVCLVIGKNVLN